MCSINTRNFIKMNLLQLWLLMSAHVLASVTWVDEADASGPIDMDIFFDRVVIITVKDPDAVKPKMPERLVQAGFLNRSYIAPGVFVTSRHVLTSFTPLKHIVAEGVEFFKHFVVSVLTHRKIVKPEQHEYTITNVTFKCAEAVVPVNESLLGKEQWHGTDKLHTPVHDLLILRVEEKLKFLPQDVEYSFNDYSTNIKRRAGPFQTKFARMGDEITGEVKFASLGFKSEQHMKNGSQLRSRTYDWSEHVVENCDDWLPRYWGHFICIKNVDNYMGVGSGSPLIYENLLFGIGSFAITKGNESLLVFTDVRPYSHLFTRICPSPDVTAEWQTTTERSTSTSAPKSRREGDAVDYSERDYL